MVDKTLIPNEIEHAVSCLRNAVVVGRRLLRYAGKLDEERAMLIQCGRLVDSVPLHREGDSLELRDELEVRRAQAPPILERFYWFADGAARADAELRVAVDKADAAVAVAARLVDVATVSAEARTTFRVRRSLQELLRRTPSPAMAGWAQVAEPSVRQRIDEALGRVVADISDLQLIATTPIDNASKTRPISGKRKRQVAGKPPLPLGPRLTKVDQAICRLSMPGRTWTVTELADDVGCAKQTLHGSTKFMRAWAGQKALAIIARGSKYDGHVEAVDEQGLTAEDET